MLIPGTENLMKYPPDITHLLHSKYLVLTGFIDQMWWSWLCILSIFYPLCVIHCSAPLSTAEKALHQFDITLHYMQFAHVIDV